MCIPQLHGTALVGTREHRTQATDASQMMRVIWEYIE